MLSEEKNILVVDDDQVTLHLIYDILKGSYGLTLLGSAQEARNYLSVYSPHLLLLDMDLADVGGGTRLAQEICAMPRHRNLPILGLVSMSDMAQQALSLKDANIVDVIIKPFTPIVLSNRVHTQLTLADLREKNDLLLAERAATATAERDLLISLFAKLAEYRDQTQGVHIQRTQAAMRLMISGYNELFPSRALSRQEADDIVLACQLHDVGKIGVPDAILLKHGTLTNEEYDIMKKHTVLGQQALEHLPIAGQPTPVLELAQQIALSHHERWDGTGYPQGLQGESIPLAARMMALIDVLDAQLSLRPYRPPLTFEQSVQKLVEGRGTLFDPDLVDVFLLKRAAFEQLYLSFGPSA